MNIQVESTLVDARSVRVKLQRGKNRVRNSCREASDAPKIAAGTPLIGLHVSLIEIRGIVVAQSTAKFDVHRELRHRDASAPRIRAIVHCRKTC